MYVANTTGGLMLQTMLYLANQTSRAAVNTLIDLPPAQKSDINDVKCFGVYGCFPLNGPWTTVTRQINVHPRKPAEIEPSYTLYTKRSFADPKQVDLNYPEALLNMNINVKGKFFVLVHGYLENGAMKWMHEMGRALLNSEPEGEATVLVVDWGGGSSPPYVQAAANIRLVGSMTAHIIHMIYEELHFENLSKFHMIGHSLGAHLSGYAGFHLQRDFGLKLGRITGMDPAAPLFTETDPIVRLDPSDADYVDVIHTDSNPLMRGGLGIHQRVGHVDFYPNGGFDNPGCDVPLQNYMQNRKNTLMETMQEFLGCNHVRSYQYFTESILSKCPFMGITCDSYESFKEGKCMSCEKGNHHCLRMGHHSQKDYVHLRDAQRIDPNKPLVLFLMTGASKPFCRMHYKLSVRVSGHDESSLHGGEVGTISVQLHSRNKRTTERIKFSEKPMYFEPGFDYHSLVPGQELADPQYAHVYWDYQTNILNPLTWRILSSPRIYLEYVLIEVMESSGVHLKLCPQHENAILSGSENILHVKYCRK